MNTLLLTSDDVRTIAARVGLDALMDEVVDALETVFRDFDETLFEIPQRSGFEYAEPETGLLEWMPAMRVGAGITVKLVGYHPGNPELRRLPTILSTALVFESGSGHLDAIVDATYATAVRTGAASAVASRVLAVPQAEVLGLIGCGAQAITQLHALTRTFPIVRVLAFDTDPRAVASLRQRAEAFDLPADIVIEPAAPAAILNEADILCTQTSVAIGGGPVLAAGPTKPHLHVNAVGSDFPGKTELPGELLESSLVCPDFRAQAVREGECQVLSEDALGPDLPELVRFAARYESARARHTVFDSTGWALEDHVVIDVLLGHARTLGLGQDVAIETLSADPANPYGGFVRLERGTIASARGHAL